MSLTSSLYSGISGLSTLGNSMQIIGDNIANVNTVAFKGSNYTFQDLLSQSVATQSGTSQVGRGTALGDISANFQQGSFESTGNTTDLAIGGKGFFLLREAGSNSQFYTRAGNFSFNNDGFLTSPEGYVVQGWALDEDTGQDVGSISDIMLDSFTSPPRQTDQITVITNLDADTISNTANLAAAWDATNEPPMAATSYAYHSTVKAYDSLGSTHDITIFYDYHDIIGGNPTWEYVVTCNPADDRRGFLVADDPRAGLLAQGQIGFSASSGNITDLNLDNLSAGGWAAAALNPDGYFEFGADFLGGVPLSIDLDIGTRHDGTGFANSSLTTTQYARASSTIFQSSTGYGAGDLQGVSVGTDGIVTGSYSNGQLIPLYRVALASFQNEQGLFKLGGNLYQETNESGDPVTNHPGTNGLGSITPNSLEQSNVDIANEFVKMITTQRGYQANSKIITTVDDMLAETIQMKR
jgi:flagellar hook protein FlgE